MFFISGRALVLVFPIFLLAIHGVLQSQILGTLIGTLAGYLLSSFGEGQTAKGGDLRKKN
jgi:hypothetical protein